MGKQHSESIIPKNIFLKIDSNTGMLHSLPHFPRNKFYALKQTHSKPKDKEKPKVNWASLLQTNIQEL